MKMACVAGLIVFCTAAGVWAGIGETKEEALKRYGEPGKWDRDALPPAGRGLIIANYTVGTQPFKVYFYDKGGKSLSGAVLYELPQGKELREAAVKKALDDNAGGKTWTVIKGTETSHDSYKRDGAKACYFKEDWLSVSSSDFDAYVSEANKKIADKQAADRLVADKQAAADKQAVAVKQAAAAQKAALAKQAAAQKAAAQKTTGKK